MSYAKYLIIDNINTNFGKLLVGCTNGLTYTPLDYTLPQNFEAYVILNQLIELSCKIKQQGNTIDNIVLTRILDNLINSKCIQFTNLPEVIQQGSNTEIFKNSFMIYLSDLITSYLHEYSSSMQF
jgi:hypothetical protein